ncbi:MAG: GNAT family N-acetyltransferase [Phycisphaeraceae bacterium]|nr:MAG: GNAT family N-acetyltransferase [Phycisphaeraceae bacterium]
MTIEPRELEGKVVRLVPLSVEDAEEMLRAASSPETFRYFTRPPSPWTVEGMEDYCRYLIESPFILPFAVRLRKTGEFVGSSVYCDLRPEHLNVEIGWTWYDPIHRGTTVNPESKYLMLEHAFGGGLFGRPAIRVCLKTDLRNEQSQRAIERIGAIRDGVLRHQALMPDGHKRDTVYFSILDDEWPPVRERLRRRIGYADSK